MAKRFSFLLYKFLFLFSVYNCYAQYDSRLEAAAVELDGGYHYSVLKTLGAIDTTGMKTADRAYTCLLLARANELISQEDEAIKNFYEAKRLYKKADSIDAAMDINIDIAYAISAQDNNKNSYEKYLKEYFNYVKKNDDGIKLARGYANMALWFIDTGEFEKSRAYFKEAINITERIDDKMATAVLYNNIAALYTEKLHKPDSALVYLNRNVELYKEFGTVDDVCNNYINIAAAYNRKGQYAKAIDYLLLADALPIKSYTLRTRQYIYSFLSENYKQTGDTRNAFHYLELYQKFADSINVADQNVAISDMQAKYETKEKELENKLLKSDVKMRNLLLSIVLGLLITLIAITVLIVLNFKRKEKLAQQQKVIEQQKYENTLKQYELNSIDMMLEGQEKERQRIANDLHDNLGSMLATLKLNFENLRMRQLELREEENKLYEKTDNLIEEAYQKVRRMAHAKNAGVFASEGLIPALKKLCEKVSVPGKIEFEIISHGFNERLSNTLEIAIFRIAQELATNIIKHAGATEASIQLTQHENDINMIVEDNGKGFDIKTFNFNEGMGLSTIKKKIEQMGGTFTVDSNKGKGTTTIIDLPL